jgi:hypothetical protein
MKHNPIHHLIAGAILAALPFAVNAATLVPGGVISVPATTAAADPSLAGTVINDDTQNLLVDVLGGGSIFAIGVRLQNRVVRSAVDGTLIFAPRIEASFNNTGANFLIDRMEITGYSDFDIDATYRVDGLGDRGPTNASRSADGNIVELVFGFPLVGGTLASQPQESSYFPSLKTDATEFSLEGRIAVFATWLAPSGNESFRFDFGGVAIPVLSTTVPTVPLPASWLLLAGALGLGGIAKRRQN